MIDAHDPVPTASAERDISAQLPGRGRGLAVTTAVVILVLAASFMGPLFGNDGRDSSTPVSDAAASKEPWLPEPWELAVSDSHTWKAGDASRYRFCGTPVVSYEAVRVTERSLVDPSGLTARLIVFTPEAGDPMNLFKFSYAYCLDEGNVESVPGPRNRWVYGATAGAAGIVGDSLHLVELEGATRKPTASEAEAMLTAWAD